MNTLNKNYIVPSFLGPLYSCILIIQGWRLLMFTDFSHCERSFIGCVPTEETYFHYPYILINKFHL